MKYFAFFILTLLISLSGCGTNDSSKSSTSLQSTGLFLDSPVKGIDYQSTSHSGVTDDNGHFDYKVGEETTFKVGNIILGSAKIATTDSVITPLELVKTVL